MDPISQHAQAIWHLTVVHNALTTTFAQWAALPQTDDRRGAYDQMKNTHERLIDRVGAGLHRDE